MSFCLYGLLPASITPKYTGLRGTLCGCLEPKGCSTWLKLQHSDISVFILLLCSVSTVLSLKEHEFYSWTDLGFLLGSGTFCYLGLNFIFQ